MISAGELERLSGYTLAGDASVMLSGMCYSYAPKPNKLLVAFTRQQAVTADADLILTDGIPLCFGKSFLYADENICMALIKIAEIMISHGVLKDYRRRSECLKNVHGAMISDLSAIGDNTQIGPFSVIEDGAQIGRNCRIGSGVFIGADCVIGDNAVIGDGSKISTESVFHCFEKPYTHFAGTGRVIVGNDVFMGSNTIIQRGTIHDTIIENGCVIGDLVDIGHDCEISESCRIVSQSGISGNVRIGKNTTIYGQCGINNFVRIGENVVVKARTVVSKNIQDGRTVSGAYGRDHIEELKLRAKLEKIINERN